MYCYMYLDTTATDTKQTNELYGCVYNHPNRPFFVLF